MRPGTRVRYTIVATNDGDTSARNVEPRGRIVASTTFVAGSTRAQFNHVEYSVDHGTTWAATPSIVVVSSSGSTRRKAEPSEYTDVRWIGQPPLPAKASLTYSYDVVVR